MRPQHKDESSTDSELLDFVTYRISQVHPRLNAQAAHILRKQAGLSLLQWRTIALLQTFGPNVPSVDLISRVGMDKGLFSRTVKGLIGAGLVTTQPDKLDHRRQLLSLTSKGAQRYESVIDVMRKRQDYLLHDVSDDERAALFSALDKIAKNAKRKDF